MTIHHARGRQKSRGGESGFSIADDPRSPLIGMCGRSNGVVADARRVVGQLPNGALGPVLRPRYRVLADAARLPTGAASPRSSPLKNRCVSGSVLNTTEPSMPRVSSTL